MSDSSNVNLRVDKELKSQAEILFSKLGINMTTAINIFLKQAVRSQSIPFKVSAEPEDNNRYYYTGAAEKYESYDAFVADQLRIADTRAASGEMKYYTSEEIRSKLEDLFSEDV